MSNSKEFDERVAEIIDKQRKRQLGYRLIGYLLRIIAMAVIVSIAGWIMMIAVMVLMISEDLLNKANSGKLL